VKVRIGQSNIGIFSAVDLSFLGSVFEMGKTKRMRFGPSGKSRVHPGGCDGSCHQPYSRESPSSIVGDALALFVTGAEASIGAIAFAGGPASAVPLPLAFLLFTSLVENLLAEEDELQALAGDVLKVTDEIVNSKIAGNEATQFGDVVNGVRNWFLNEPFPKKRTTSSALSIRRS
jgi:hypothetical protein